MPQLQYTWHNVALNVAQCRNQIHLKFEEDRKPEMTFTAYDITWSDMQIRVTPYGMSGWNSEGWIFETWTDPNDLWACQQQTIGRVLNSSAP